MLKWGYLIIRRYSANKPMTTGIRYTINAAFGKYLFVTNTVSSGVLMFLGDLIQQEFQYQVQNRRKQNIKKREYDYERMVRMFLVGLTMGPVHHYYYKYINSVWPKSDLVSVTKKILADQLVMSPICIAQFFYTLGYLESKSMQQCNEEILGKFGSVYTMDWCIWPPAQFINFYLIPWKYQVIYINTITMIYNVFLSYIKHENVLRLEELEN